jgi:hypothetical protein
MTTAIETGQPKRFQLDGLGMIFDVDESTRLRPKDLNLQLFAQASWWFNKLAIFRHGEVYFFYDSAPTDETLKDHKAIVEKLIWEAEEIIRRAQVSGGMFKSENGFTLQDLEAAVEELKITKLQWHGKMSNDRKLQILSLLSDEPKS